MRMNAHHMFLGFSLEQLKDFAYKSEVSWKGHIVRQFLHALLKLLLWLSFLEYCNQIYRRHVDMDKYESL